MACCNIVIKYNVQICFDTAIKIPKKHNIISG